MYKGWEFSKAILSSIIISVSYHKRSRGQERKTFPAYFEQFEPLSSFRFILGNYCTFLVLFSYFLCHKLWCLASLIKCKVGKGFSLQRAEVKNFLRRPTRPRHSHWVCHLDYIQSRNWYNLMKLRFIVKILCMHATRAGGSNFGNSFTSHTSLTKISWNQHFHFRNYYHTTLFQNFYKLFQLDGKNG